MQAEEQQRQRLFQTDLSLRGEFQADAGAAEIDVHDDRRGQALDHRGAKRRNAVQRLRAQTEEFQLFGQAFGAVVILQHHIDRFAQRWQESLVELIAMAQAGA
ncbi:hypothetical protein D3C73_211780 [compost metagenome]